ncbi:hypothetical protein N9M16_02070 [Candidatus Dependentiae bacterium]|nr:hypothetical protein [Candidatus Dependentiae bacterium]
MFNYLQVQRMDCGGQEGHAFQSFHVDCGGYNMNAMAVSNTGEVSVTFTFFRLLTSLAYPSCARIPNQHPNGNY